MLLAAWISHNSARCNFSIANEGTGDVHCRFGESGKHPQMVVEWSELPLDNELLGEVLAILAPIHDWFYIEGRPENNDPPPASNSGDLA